MAVEKSNICYFSDDKHCILAVIILMSFSKSGTWYDKSFMLVWNLVHDNTVLNQWYRRSVTKPLKQNEEKSFWGTSSNLLI